MRRARRFVLVLFSAIWSMTISPHSGQGRERVTAETWISTFFSQWGQTSLVAGMRAFFSVKGTQSLCLFTRCRNRHIVHFSPTS
jgi:hypothetical protein